MHRCTIVALLALLALLLTPLTRGAGQQLRPSGRSDTGIVNTQPGPAPSWCDSAEALDSLSRGRRIQLVACSSSPADSIALRRVFPAMTRAVTLYSRLTGVPYPWPRLSMRIIPFPGANGGGMTLGNGQVLYDLPWPADLRTERDRPTMSAKIFAHELAHQWRNQRVGLGWLDEGFPDFLAAQIWGGDGDPRGEEEFLFFYNAKWAPAYSQNPITRASHTLDIYAPSEWTTVPWAGAELWAAPLASPNNDDRYYRVALVLWMLQQYLGDSHFWAAIHTLLTDPTPTGDVTRDLLHAIRQVTGEELTWFFQEWVTNGGYPRFTIASSYDAAARRVTLQVKQTAPAFRMPVTIRIGTTQGDVLEHATVTGLAQTIVVDHVMQPPTFIVFDDGDAVVKTLEFPQLTPWLAAQVRREGRPWQTWWAIEQLRQRVNHDPEAAAALIVAARNSHYSLTRAQALVALAGVPTPAATAAALDGVRDTAVIVRRAAIYDIVASGTPEAHVAARTVLTHDASDLVRAEAFQALLMTPATPLAERDTLFAQALLGPPAYLDIVPMAAVKAMTLAGTCDSTTVTVFQHALLHPGVSAMLQRVIDILTMTADPAADPTCLQTFAAQLPMSKAVP